MRNNRSIGIVLISSYFAVLGLVFCSGGLLAILSGTESWSVYVGVLSLLLSAGNFLVAVGLLMQKAKIYVLSISVATLNVLFWLQGTIRTLLKKVQTAEEQALKLVWIPYMLLVLLSLIVLFYLLCLQKKQLLSNRKSED
jgi:hypothetical protein